MASFMGDADEHEAHAGAHEFVAWGMHSETYVAMTSALVMATTFVCAASGAVESDAVMCALGASFAMALVTCMFFVTSMPEGTEAGMRRWATLGGTTWLSLVAAGIAFACAAIDHGGPASWTAAFFVALLMLFHGVVVLCRPTFFASSGLV